MEREQNIEKASIITAITKLKSWRDEWESSVPEEEVDGGSEKRNYKVRNNWFQGVVSCLELVVLPLLSPSSHGELIGEINNFVNKCCNKEFIRRLKTKEDIVRADELINKAIEVLEKL